MCKTCKKEIEDIALEEFNKKILKEANEE